MIKISGLKKSYGSKNIFDGVDLSIPKGIKGGVVGVNGAGKSTLFQILSGMDKDYEGEVTFDTNEPLIGYMHQQISILEQEQTIYDYLRDYTGIGKIEDRIYDLMQNLDSQSKIEEYGELYEMFEKLGGYEFDSKAYTVLNNFGLGKYDIYSSEIKSLSGGEKNKLLLSATLLKGGDLLLLDEPTNNLDNNSIEGLSSYIKNTLVTCLVITHDKEFLNGIAQKIYEVLDGKINEFTGDYEFYEEQKKIEYDKQLEEYNRQQEEFKRAEQARKDLSSRASGIEQKGNVRDNDKGDGPSKVSKKLSKQAKSMRRKTEMTEKVDKPKEKKPLSISLELSNIPTGGISLENIKYKYESSNFELNIPRFEIGKNDKILILGENGQGKTTFANILYGNLQLETGQVKVNNSIQIGYFSQEDIDLPMEKTSIEYLESSGNFSFEEINYVLSKVGFENMDKGKAIKLLSPGMRLRLRFSLLMLQKCNCIIFDEPTNHVDIETKKQLEKAINEFKGIAIIISHDNNFIENVNFNREIYFKDGVIEENTLISDS